MAVEDLIRMQQEVMSGFEWGDPRSKIEDTPANKRTYLNIQKDIADMDAKGIMPSFVSYD